MFLDRVRRTSDKRLLYLLQKDNCVSALVLVSRSKGVAHRFTVKYTVKSLLSLDEVLQSICNDRQSLMLRFEVFENVSLMELEGVRSLTIAGIFRVS